MRPGSTRFGVVAESGRDAGFSLALSVCPGTRTEERGEERGER